MSRCLPVLLALLGAAPVAAAEIKVVEDAGTKLDPGGTTRLRFRADAPTIVSRVISSGSTYASGSAGSLGGYQQTLQKLCTTPCELEVPNGAYELKPGENLLFGLPFAVTAAGGTQTWELEDASATAGLFGILGTGIGLGLVAGGGLAMASDDDVGGLGGGTLALIGAPIAGLGLWSLIAAFSDAELVAQ